MHRVAVVAAPIPRVSTLHQPGYKPLPKRGHTGRMADSSRASRHSSAPPTPHPNPFHVQRLLPTTAAPSPIRDASPSLWCMRELLARGRGTTAGGWGWGVRGGGRGTHVASASHSRNRPRPCSGARTPPPLPPRRPLPARPDPPASATRAGPPGPLRPPPVPPTTFFPLIRRPSRIENFFLKREDCLAQRK